MSKISIVIPCYNAQGYIGKCLNALVKQSYKDFEVIIIDDCSDDDTVSVVTEWAAQCDLSIKVITNEINLGPSLSRYKGAMSSVSEWVTFCDSDDWYEPNFLEKMIQMAEKHNCDIVFCGYQSIIGDRVIEHPLGEISRCMIPHDALYINVDALWRTFVKRDIYVNTPQPDIRNGEDMAVIPLLIQSASKVGLLNDVLYNYYIRPGSVSLCPSDKMIDSLVESFEHIHKYMNNIFYNEKEYLGVRNMIYGCLLNLFKFSYNTKKARSILQNFEKFYPNWSRNPMLSQMPIFKRCYVWCAKHRLYILMWLLSKAHTIMIKF